MRFREALKVVYIVRISYCLGETVQSFGAAHVNERSPRVVRLLNTGYFNKSVSELVLRLYLPSFFSSMSSDRYRGARPLRVLYTSNNILNWIQ